MASPQQRPDPDRPVGPDSVRRRADLKAVEAWEIRTRGSGAGWFAWWWVWLLVILCAIWFAGWGWGGYGGWWWGNRGGGYNNGAAMRAGAAGTAAAGNGVPAELGPGARSSVGTTDNMNIVTDSGAAILASTDKQTFIGKPFQANDAVVTKRLNDRVLWIGLNDNNGNSASMLVVLRGTGNNAANAHLAQGDLVNVTGMVEKAPPAAQAKRNWKLSANGQKQLEQQGAYVAARQVRRESNGNNG